MTAINSAGSESKAEAADNVTCASPRCKCPVTVAGEYCSPTCEKHESEKYCSCGHPDICFLECDLVMKGGITSGIVYPPLVLKLKDHYRFRSVGGTSAGAIGAAVTAAAEYGRASGGFEKLKRVNDDLKKPDFLQRLFQPAGNARPLMETLIEAADFYKAEKSRTTKQSTLQKLRRYTSKLSETLSKTNPTVYRSGTLRGLRYALIAALVISVLASLMVLLASLVMGVSLLLSAYTFILTFLLFSLILAWPGYKFGGWGQGIYDLCLILFQKVPKDNYFGICNGRTDVEANENEKNKTDGKDRRGKQQEALTDWLCTSIDWLAGRKAKNRPLTFGELWEPKDDKGRVRIDLRMVTSNLSQNQPYVLPFEQNLFIFKETDFETLFPKAIVKHMLDHQRPCIGFKLPKGYHFLPEAKDLPVAVATRMSLSFPLLISMVPLYTLSHEAFGQNKVKFEYLTEKDEHKKEIIVLEEIVEEQFEGSVQAYWKVASNPERWPTVVEEHLQRNWFSDGGICSNFPMHFFDSWLPSRPTFGVNLTSQLTKNPTISLPLMDLTGESAKAEVVNKERFSYCGQQSISKLEPGAQRDDVYEGAVYLPPPDNDPAPEWIPIKSLGSFLGSIFTTAQNYRDNMQAALPSYRERIVQIRLTDKEGGLNLGMDCETIEKVFKKGQAAGDALLNNFEFDVHQWVRFRVLMNQIEKSLTKMSQVLNDSKFYLETLQGKADPTRASRFPYGREPGWCTDAEKRVNAINKVIAEWKAMKPPIIFQEASPLPEPVLRVTPML